MLGFSFGLQGWVWNLNQNLIQEFKIEKKIEIEKENKKNEPALGRNPHPRPTLSPL
jgi:hypothetical protein